MSVTELSRKQNYVELDLKKKKLNADNEGMNSMGKKL